MEIYNTISRRKEELEVKDNKIRMFVCGPTVYDYIHIGNARTFVVFDMVAKYLRYKGYDVEYIQNITDIDDKIIIRAQETGQEPLRLAKDFENKFYEDMAALGVDSVNRYAPASEHIPEVVKQVKKLIATGHAYLIEGDGWYFDLKTFSEYGKLSGRTAEMADDAVSRIDENPNKRNRGDFALWKFSRPGEPSWLFPSETGDAPEGEGLNARAMSALGRPGWHIEDTAITEK
ncbi:MAG: class I tRNA ligase family protein, partial [Parcubacteria group bacterium]|nr:class I tRNA ligase family protein [Parcubacteria group bacterium]